MFSRQALIKKPVKHALTLLKVENVSHIHVVCPHARSISLLVGRNGLRTYKRSVLCSGLPVRFQSSAQQTTPAGRAATDVPLDPIPEPPIPLSELTQSAAEIIGEPSFASQGLGSMWPSGWVQTAMEFLHVDWGLPWWGAVVAGSLIIRLIMFPVVVISQRNSAKLNNNLPEMQFLQLKITEARQRGDKLDTARYTNEMVKFMQEKEVNPLKSMIPPLLQAPVFISVFMGLRGMANLPVESLKTGGLLWFVDLTVPDQFYLLPIITSATLYCTVKLGVDAAPSTSQNAGLVKYMMIGLPIIMLPMTVSFPGLLLCYWTTANFISLMQVGILRIPAVRKYCNIPQRIRHDKEKLPQQSKGFVKSVKEAWTNMKITGELQQRERADKMAFMAAGREPIVKTYKYDPTQVRAKSSSASQAKSSLSAVSQTKTSSDATSQAKKKI